MFNNFSSLNSKINFIKLSKHNMGYVSNCNLNTLNPSKSVF